MQEKLMEIFCIAIAIISSLFSLIIILYALYYFIFILPELKKNDKYFK